MSNFYWYIRAAETRVECASSMLVLTMLLILLNGCATSQEIAHDEVSVQGVVSVRGHEPFTELVLQTADRNYYVLKFADPEERSRMQNASPASFAVRGEVYRDVWGSRAFAHLRVLEWAPTSN